MIHQIKSCKKFYTACVSGKLKLAIRYQENLRQSQNMKNDKIGLCNKNSIVSYMLSIIYFVVSQNSILYYHYFTKKKYYQWIEFTKIVLYCDIYSYQDMR